MSTKKIPLLYVGPGYTMFTQSQCNQLVSQSGATEFQLTTAYAFNYCREGDPILTQYSIYYIFFVIIIITHRCRSTTS